MNLCSSGHEEIVYDELCCPLCERLLEIEGLENVIKDLEEKESDGGIL